VTTERLVWAVRFAVAADVEVRSVDAALSTVRYHRWIGGARRALGLAPAGHHPGLEPTEGRRRLAAAVGSLSALERAALAFVDGCEVESSVVARGLGVAPWRVRRALRRGRSAVRRSVAMPAPAAEVAFDPFVGPALRAVARRDAPVPDPAPSLGWATARPLAGRALPG
jgi:hypothetical protein